MKLKKLTSAAALVLGLTGCQTLGGLRQDLGLDHKPTSQPEASQQQTVIKDACAEAGITVITKENGYKGEDKLPLTILDQVGRRVTIAIPYSTDRWTNMGHQFKGQGLGADKQNRACINQLTGIAVSKKCEDAHAIVFKGDIPSGIWSQHFNTYKTGGFVVLIQKPHLRSPSLSGPNTAAENACINNPLAKAAMNPNMGY